MLSEDPDIQEVLELARVLHRREQSRPIAEHLAKVCERLQRAEEELNQQHDDYCQHRRV